MNAERAELARSINTAIARLMELRDGAYGASITTTEIHAESIKLYGSYTRTILEITTDLEIAVAGIPASLADRELTSAEITDIRECAGVRDVLVECDEIADRMIEEATFGDDYYPVKRRVA